MKLIVDLGSYEAEDNEVKQDVVTALVEYDFPVQEVQVLR